MTAGRRCLPLVAPAAVVRGVAGNDFHDLGDLPLEAGPCIVRGGSSKRRVIFARVLEQRGVCTLLGQPKTRHLDEPITVSLEDLVPHDHFYRHLQAKLDLSFVREWVREL